jgi:hypothetical protein
MSCSKGLHYGVASLSPASGPEKGGNVVKFTPTTVFADSAYALCRFDLAVVPARVLSQHELECNAPPHAGGEISAEGVPVQVPAPSWHRIGGRKHHTTSYDIIGLYGTSLRVCRMCNRCALHMCSCPVPCALP